MTIVYTARAWAKGGRGGHTETDDKKLSFDLSSPGSNGAGTNPEQLFACGYSACFGGALAFIAGQKKIELPETPVVHADINLNKTDAGFHLSGTLNVVLNGVDDALAAELIHATHEFCPYSKATRGNVEVTLLLNGKPV